MDMTGCLASGFNSKDLVPRRSSVGCAGYLRNSRMNHFSTAKFAKSAKMMRAMDFFALFAPFAVKISFETRHRRISGLAETHLKLEWPRFRNHFFGGLM